MKRLFITGAASSLGQSLLDKIGSTTPLIALQHNRPLPERPNQRIITGSLSDLPLHRESIKKCSHVLHLAALSHTRKDQDYLTTNVEGTQTLLKLCDPSQHFVYMSSRCIDPNGGAYSHSKHLAEQAIQSAGIPHTIIRPSEVYGSHGNEGIDALLNMAIQRRLIIDIITQPKVSFSPISVDSVIEFTHELLTTMKAEDQVYTLCASRSYTVRDLQKITSEALQKKVLRIPIPYNLMRTLLMLPIPLPVQPDQLARLVSQKSTDNSAARDTGSFNPQPFEQYIHQRVNSHE